MLNDSEITALFFERSENAVAELDGKYGTDCHSLAMHFLGNRQDAEECVNDAYLAVWNAIPPAQPKPLKTFVLKIVRNISVNRYHANAAQKRNTHYDVSLSELDECGGVDNVQHQIGAAELTALLEAFLRGQSACDAAVFIRRYWYCQSYAEIASAVGISQKNVSVRLARLRKQLKAYFIREGILDER